MPNQTTITDYVYFPDGCKVQVKESGAGSYTDIGAVGSDVTATLNYDVSEYESANAGDLASRLKNMSIDCAFTLINLNPANLVKLSGGLLTQTTTAASPNAAIPNQDIASGWTDGQTFELIMYTSSSDSTKLKMTSAPTLTSVTADPDGTPEVLNEGSDYLVIEDANSYSGYSITFYSANFGTASEGDEIEIDYGSNTPVASTTIHAGSSIVTLAAAALKFTHTDSNSLVRELEIHSVDPLSGGFQFNYKAATADGVEEMPLTLKGKIDSSLTDGQQLMSWTVDNGAA